MTKSIRFSLVASIGLLILIVLALAALGNADLAEACNGGKCSDPLPTQANACDAPGVGPVHKCGPTPTPSPVVVEKPENPTPTATSFGVVVTPESLTPQPASTQEPTSQPTAEPTASPTGESETCQLGDAECDSCAIVKEALAQGKIIVIADEDYVTIIDDAGQVVFGHENAVSLAAGLTQP